MKIEGSAKILLYARNKKEPALQPALALSVLK
jgi:hypothetical protein